MYALEWRTLHALTRELFWCFLCSKTLVRALREFVTRVYTLSYFSNDITNPYMTIKITIFTHHPLCHSLGFRSDYDVTVDCWWRHDDQIIVTRACEKLYLTRYTSIFIHGDIHGRSCKNIRYNTPTFCLFFLIATKQSTWSQQNPQSANCCIHSLDK